MHIWVDIRCLLWFLEQGPSPGLGLASFARMAAGKPQESSRLCRLSTGIRVADLGVCECAGARAQAITLARETIYPESFLPTLSGVFLMRNQLTTLYITAWRPSLVPRVLAVGVGLREPWVVELPFCQ